MADGIEVWGKVMSVALAIPGVKVDRDSFLRTELRPYCSSDQLEKAIINPVNVLSRERIDKLGDACINNHLIKVSSLSFFAGLPGGFAAAATIPADLAQYYWHTFVLAQKLAYLYGLPDLKDENGNFTEMSRNMLTIFVGVMMGAGVANEIFQKASKAFAEQVAKRLPQMSLSKTLWYPMIKQIAKWLGVSMSKGTFAKALSKSIPLIGGLISGGLTAATFHTEAKRLQEKLRNQMNDITHNR